jgi:hypothetical protein
VEEVNAMTVRDLDDKNVMIYSYVFDLNAFNLYRHQLIHEEFAFRPELRGDGQRFLRRSVEAWTVRLAGLPDGLLTN